MEKKTDTSAGFDPKTASAQMLEFMKSSFDTTFDSVVKLQAMNEKMLKEMIEKSKELQASGVKTVDDFIENSKKGRDQYRKMMEEGFEKIQNMMGPDK